MCSTSRSTAVHGIARSLASVAAAIGAAGSSAQTAPQTQAASPTPDTVVITGTKRNQAEQDATQSVNVLSRTNW